ncbi:hypothetical protein ACH5RR_009335 [Cinchona calisaya]|uniref:Uncharacterized protein n=1 Tax=Cinchona calisaya TaxID=153742 RepID=A0ABD3AIC6_9GENT
MKSMNTNKKYVSRTGIGHVETGVCCCENDACHRDLPSSDNNLNLFSDENLVEIMNCMSRELDSSSANRQNQKHASTSVPLTSEPSFSTGRIFIVLNPYAKFFKGLRDVTDLENQIIVLNSNLSLYQRLYNLPSSSQVAAIWTEFDDQTLDRSAHIQVYTHSNTSHKIKHYFSCYDLLQYPLLFPRDESGYHHCFLRNSSSKKRKINAFQDEALIDPSLVQNASELIHQENRGKFSLTYILGR